MADQFPTPQDFYDAEKDLRTMDAVSNSRDPDTDAEIDTWLTRRGGQTDTLAGRMKKLGVPVVGSTTGGATLSNANEVVLNNTPGSAGFGNYYSWGGTFPHIVAPGTDPALVGSGYIPRSDVVLREALASSIGATIIGSCASFSELRAVTPEREGARIFLTGWNPDSTFGSGWFMAETTSQADNGGTIAGSGALKWVKIDKYINSYTFGALPADTDFLIPVQAAFDASAYSKFTVNFTEDHELPVSSTVLVKSGSKIKWSNSKAYIKLTADAGYGGVVGLLGRYHDNGGVCENVYLENVLVDGNNIGHPTGDTQGQNGLSGSAVKNIRVRGVHAKNCARSSSAKVPEFPITGGKGVFFEYGVEDVIVDNPIAENCYIAFGGSGQETYLDGPGHCRRLQYDDAVAINCESVLIVSRAYSGNVDNNTAGYCDVKADITAYNCGLGGSLSSLPATAFDRGLVIMDRAADCDVKVRLINLPGYGKIDSLLRGLRMYNCKVDISANAETRTLFNNNAIVGGQTNGVLRNNVISLSNIGPTDYAADMLNPDTQQRGNDIKLFINNPLTALLTAAASGHGLMLELIRMDTNNPVQRIKGLAADIYRRFNTWALVPNGSLDLTGVSVGTNYTRTINRDGSATIRFTVTMAAGGAAQVFNYPLALPAAATILFPKVQNGPGSAVQGAPAVNAVSTSSITLQDQSASAASHLAYIEVTGVVPNP